MSQSTKEKAYVYIGFNTLYIPLDWGHTVPGHLSAPIMRNLDPNQYLCPLNEKTQSLMPDFEVAPSCAARGEIASKAQEKIGGVEDDPSRWLPRKRTSRCTNNIGVRGFRTAPPVV